MKTAVRAVSGDCFFRYCPLFLYSVRCNDILRLHRVNITHRIKSAVQNRAIAPSIYIGRYYGSYQIDSTTH